MDSTTLFYIFILIFRVSSSTIYDEGEVIKSLEEGLERIVQECWWNGHNENAACHAVEHQGQAVGTKKELLLWLRDSGAKKKPEKQYNSQSVLLFSPGVLSRAATAKRPENPFALGCSVGLSERFLFIQQLWKVYYEASPMVLQH